MKKLKAVSVQSIIISSIIIGVISFAGIAALWPSVEKSKIYIIAETIDEQNAYITSQIEFDYNKILTLNASGDGDGDYLDELIEAGQISNIPYNLFQEPEVLEWEIRSVIVDNRIEFYHFLNSPNTEDLKLLLEALEHRGII